MNATAGEWRSITDERKKYKAYLCSREWAERREAVRERSGDICERCEVLPQDAVHHLTYENKYDEPLKDLQAICTPCHEFTHGKSEFDPLPNARFIEWLSIPCITDTPWLDRHFKSGFPGNAFEYAPLASVFHAWVVFQFTYMTQQEMAGQDLYHADGTPLATEELYVPTMAEIAYQKGLTPAQRSFWSWLCWNCPSEHPIGSRAAFNRCHELAHDLRQRRASQ